MVDNSQYLFTTDDEVVHGGHTPAAASERADQDTVAVKYGDRTWTWREHIAEARAQAAALIASPIPTGRCTSAS